MGELSPIIIGLVVLLFVTTVAVLGMVSRRRAALREQRARASAVLHESLCYGEEGDGPTCGEPARPEASAELGQENRQASHDQLAVPRYRVPSADYALFAPVELHFNDNEGRVGVRVGTALHTEFVKAAGLLLDDLEDSRTR